MKNINSLSVSHGLGNLLNIIIDLSLPANSRGVFLDLVFEVGIYFGVQKHRRFRLLVCRSLGNITTIIGYKLRKSENIVLEPIDSIVGKIKRGRFNFYGSHDSVWRHSVEDIIYNIFNELTEEELDRVNLIGINETGFVRDIPEKKQEKFRIAVGNFVRKSRGN